MDLYFYLFREAMEKEYSIISECIWEAEGKKIYILA